MQSTPGDRQPLEDEGLKAGQLGRGLSTTSHTTCIGPSNTYSGSGLKKNVQGDCEGVYVCAHMHAWLCVASSVFVLSAGWDAVLMMKDSSAIE